MVSAKLAYCRQYNSLILRVGKEEAKVAHRALRRGQMHYTGKVIKAFVIIEAEGQGNCDIG